MNVNIPYFSLISSRGNRLRSDFAVLFWCQLQLQIFLKILYAFAAETFAIDGICLFEFLVLAVNVFVSEIFHEERSIFFPIIVSEYNI